MNMPLVLLNRRRRGGAAAFTPAGLFALAEPGLWLDPSDLTTLFTDTAGTTPVTTPGQTVALALDKSKGLVLGSELRGTGTTGLSGTATAATYNTGTGVGTASRVDSGNQSFVSFGSTVANNFYLFSIQNTGATSLVLRINNSGGTALQIVSAGTSFAGYLTGGTSLVVTAQNNGTTASFTVISVKELPGFHATQATLASRPTYGIVPLGGRRNLLTRTEEFENAVWTKAATSSVSANSTLAPNGTLTADTYSQTGSVPYLAQAITLSAAGAVTVSIRLKKSVGDHIRLFVVDTATLSNGFGCWVNIATTPPSIGTTGTIGTGGTFTSASVSDLGNDWREVRISGQAGAATNISLGLFISSADNSPTRVIPGSVFIWGAQLETGSSATAYQRVGSAFDVTEAGVASLSYLSFDGVDDFMVTPTITPGIDKAQVFAGVRKLSDAAGAILLEHSANINTNAGSFYITAPEATGASGNYAWKTRGSINPATPISSATTLAPTTNVVVGVGDIAADLATLRINGVQASTSSADQGTGNYLAYPIYIGRRGGSSLPFNGNIFSLIVRFGTNLDAGTITSTETWVNGKTGAYA